jgi:hypothetical protein
LYAEEQVIVKPMTTGKFPLTLLLMIVIMSSVSFLLIQEASASVELAYDDGTSEQGIAGNPDNENQKFLAVKFSLPSGCSSARLLSARFYKEAPETDDTNVIVHILGSDGVTELTAPFTYDIAVDNSWNEVDLLGKNIIVKGDFFVAVEYLIRYDPYLGYDLASVSGRSYEGTPGNWIPSPRGNYMIRAVIECGSPVGGIAVPTNKFEILTPYLALAGLIIAVSTVYVIKKRID